MISSSSSSTVDPYVQRWVAGTNGRLYVPLVNRLARYPIPNWPGPRASSLGAPMLDVGCGWGRWMVSAACAGYRPVGIDIKPDAVAAATRVLRSHGHAGGAFVAGLTALPFPDDHFDLAFSYSVLQHVPRSHAAACLKEIRRVLKPNGRCMIELPLKPGLTNWRHGSTDSEDAACWAVRYYGWREILNLFSGLFEDVTLATDCILGIGVKVEDLDILPWRYRPVALASECFRRLSQRFPLLVRLSDSVYVCARRSEKTI
jgi:ubiquinone/menaquinone biosynthesis C-methylase UbiE